MTDAALRPAAGFPTVLRDADRNGELATRGFTVLPLLAPETVAELVALQASLAASDDEGLSVDYMRPDRTVMRRLAEALEPVWATHLPQVFVGHRAVMSTFVVKHPGHLSGMFLHEDRSYVDERQARAHSVWIPLCDVGPDTGNGGLEIVPGSHRLATGLGGSHTPDLFRPYERHLRERLVPVSARAGDAVVYDTRTLHASGPNLGEGPRVALVCAVAPVDQPLLHVVATSRTHRRVHRVTPAFFVEHHPRQIEVGMPAECPVVDEYDEEPALPPEVVASVLGPPAPAEDPVVPDHHRRPGDPVTFPALAFRDHARSSGQGEEIGLGAGEVHELPPSPAARDVVVLETPAVAAGIRTADAAATFVPGRSIRLEPEAVTVLWNDGPGEARVRIEPVRRRRLRSVRGGR